MTRTIGARDRVVTAPAQVGDQRHAELQRARLVTLGLLAVSLPLVMGTIVWSSPGGIDDYNRRLTLAPFDIALVLLIFLAVVDRRPVPRWGQLSVAARIAAVLGAVLAIAIVFHPSPRGFELVFRLVGVLAVADAIRCLDDHARRTVLAIVAGVGCFEALIGLAQSAHGGELGLGQLEVGGYFYRFGTSTAGRAGLPHPYHLACYLMVAVAAVLVGIGGSRRERALWLAAGAVLAAGVATTYSRAGLLSIAGVVLFAAIAPRDPCRGRAVRALSVAIAVGFVFGALAFGNGWWSRGEAISNAGGQVENVDSGRTERAKEALRLVDAHPLTGVGPGRYVIGLDTVQHQQDVLLPAHNIVLHEAGEAGVIAGFLTLALGVALVVRYAHGGALAMAVFCSIALFFVVDAYPYVFPSGLAITGFWLGFLEVARGRAPSGQLQPS